MTAALLVETGSGPLAGRRRAAAIATVLASMTLAVLDAGMTTAALPNLARAFSVTPASAILVVTAYQAGLIMALLPMGAVGERFGHRRVFWLSLVLFALASASAAVAPGLPWLAAARFVQGIAGAGIMGLGVALLRFTVPKAQLGAAIGWNALTVALASAAAPSVGALVLALADWRGLFALNLPVAALALLGAHALPDAPRRPAPLDFVSIGLNGLTFAAFILAAQALASHPGRAAGLLALSVAAFAVFARREAPKAAPLLPLDLLRRAAFRLSVIASVCCFTAQTAGLLALPFLLQRRMGLTPLSAGLCVTLWPLSVALAAAVVGRLADRLPTAWICALGAAALCVGLAGCAVLAGASRPELLTPWIALGGLGFGLFQSPNNRNMFLAAPAERAGATGGMQGTARVSGQTLGALATALLFAGAPLESALPVALGLAAAAALTGGLVSLLRLQA
ncbi:MFS transporter [Phenylobacterium sp.]|uniref:MFS transporter n=1 Tax=Phenylobacterium sp. TaxID=1871053 RepID=UPI0025E5FC4C|nr:MFS transporter [Phenylobacterium sp.]